jgi:hypothetical protein
MHTIERNLIKCEIWLIKTAVRVLMGYINLQELRSRFQYDAQNVTIQ